MRCKTHCDYIIRTNEAQEWEKKKNTLKFRIKIENIKKTMKKT